MYGRTACSECHILEAEVLLWLAVGASAGLAGSKTSLTWSVKLFHASAAAGAQSAAATGSAMTR